jgi:hypothetical protein
MALVELGRQGVGEQVDDRGRDALGGHRLFAKGIAAIRRSKFTLSGYSRSGRSRDSHCTSLVDRGPRGVQQPQAQCPPLHWHEQKESGAGVQA